MAFRPTRKELFEVLRQKAELDKSDQCTHLQEFLIEKLELQDRPADEVNELRKAVSRYCSEVYRRWEDSFRVKDRFLKANSEWLEKEFVVPKGARSRSPPAMQSTGGRPKKVFASSSSRSKRRKTSELRKSSTTAELAYAAQMSLRSAGKETAAKLLHEMVETTPKRAERIRKAWVDAKTKPTKQTFSEDEALSLIVEAKLTKNQYLLIRSQAKEKQNDIYPSYHRIRKAKEQCYPSKDSISVSEVSAEVKLQALLDHTACRIAQVQEPVIAAVPDNNFVLISKWGCDGSTGQSQYKQKFTDLEDQHFTDSDLFLTSVVPLQLYSKEDGSSDKRIIWQNPRPSSTRFCRPIRFQFIKETTEITTSEKDHIGRQIKELLPTTTEISGKEINIKHQLLLTMIDGKVCNALTTTASAQKCYVCGASPTEMNDLGKVVQRDVDASTFSFGLSTLHAWIRFFECLLHISYRLEIKKWQVRGHDNKEKVKERKNVIQKRFRSEMGLLVDQPKPGGSGTTNDGNTSRRFFADPAKSSLITGISEPLIRRFGVILHTISSGYSIDDKEFDKYAKETAKLYVDLYPWFYMPASVHKILVHGSAIITAAILPIGQLSEEAQEARNKDCKSYREGYTRKCSRVATNQDLLNRLLLSSDPVISSLRRLPQKKKGSMPPEVLSLLAVPQISDEEELPDDETSTEGSDEDSFSSE